MAGADRPPLTGGIALPFEPALPLRTERLVLRGWEPDDAETLFDLHARPDVHRWLYTSALTRDGLAALVEEKVARRHLADDRQVNLGAWDAATGGFVGDVMLRVWSAPHRQGEIGFVLHPDAQGRGYATEAAGRLLRLGFEEAGFHRIIGRLEARNEGSARVLERLGMRREAHFVENEWVKDGWESEVVYAILAREWRALVGAAAPAANPSDA